jgi:hypothetical protein
MIAGGNDEEKESSGGNDEVKESDLSEAQAAAQAAAQADEPPQGFQSYEKANVWLSCLTAQQAWDDQGSRIHGGHSAFVDAVKNTVCLSSCAG